MQPLLLVLGIITSPGSDASVSVLYTNLCACLEAHLENTPLKSLFSNLDMDKYFTKVKITIC